jgi:signal transduction histidine kinase
MATATDIELRVLICAPRGRDALLVAKILSQSGIGSKEVSSPTELFCSLQEGAGALIITEEALTTSALIQLRLALAEQPPWSDLPVIILTSGGNEGSERTWNTVRRLDQGANMSLLERPLRTVTLLSAVHVALRSRHRQYEVRSMTAELERRVEERTEELQRLIKEAEGFSYTISHDLRAPLRAIVATSHILREDYAPLLPPEAREELNRQAASANSLAQLIDDLLRLSRLSREQMRTEEIDFSRIAEQVVSQVSTPEGPMCTFQIQPGLKAYGDSTLVQFALLNLIQNACKFSPAGGVVKIGKAPNGAYFVCDEGIGFDPKYVQKIFMPFERLVTTYEFPGTGIGLANVKRIVERHGGEVWAESDGPGRGACFRFTLPAKAERTWAKPELF